eukprot:13236032-Alexandrium_andersonii.AAC.1
MHPRFVLRSPEGDGDAEPRGMAWCQDCAPTGWAEVGGWPILLPAGAAQASLPLAVRRWLAIRPVDPPRRRTSDWSAPPGLLSPLRAG